MMRRRSRAWAPPHGIDVGARLPLSPEELTAVIRVADAGRGIAVDVEMAVRRDAGRERGHDAVGVDTPDGIAGGASHGRPPQQQPARTRRTIRNAGAVIGSRISVTVTVMSMSRCLLVERRVTVPCCEPIGMPATRREGHRARHGAVDSAVRRTTVSQGRFDVAVQVTLTMLGLVISPAVVTTVKSLTRNGQRRRGQEERRRDL